MMGDVLELKKKDQKDAIYIYIYIYVFLILLYIIDKKNFLKW